MLARFPKLEEDEPSPVSGFSASASGIRISRERRRTVLFDGDGSCGGCFSNDVGEHCCLCWCCSCCGGRCATRARFASRADASVALSSRRRIGTTPSPGGSSDFSDFATSVFSSATDDMDDWERRGLPSVLGAEEDAVGVEMEIEAAWRVMRFAKAADDDDSARDRVVVEAVDGGVVVAAANARTPPTRPLIITAPLLLASANADDADDVEVCVEEGTLRPKSRFTMRSHLRLRSSNSDSCVAS
jgi:hypothetical protein